MDPATCRSPNSSRVLKPQMSCRQALHVFTSCCTYGLVVASCSKPKSLQPKQICSVHVQHAGPSYHLVRAQRIAYLSAQPARTNESVKLA